MQTVFCFNERQYNLFLKVYKKFIKLNLKEDEQFSSLHLSRSKQFEELLNFIDENCLPDEDEYGKF